MSESPKRRRTSQEAFLSFLGGRGERMEEVIVRLEGAGASYLVLSHTPSTLISRHALTPVMFPACRDPLLRRDDTDINCLYAPHRLAKVVWSPVQNEAPALYRSVST